jgi:hypothetical protein
MVWVINAKFRPLYPETISRYPLCKRLGGHRGTIWTDLEKLTRTGIRSPDRPACSGSLHRLSYSGSQPFRSIQYINGTPVPKRVGVGTYHELCFMICNLLYFIVRTCRLTYWLQETARYERQNTPFIIILIPPEFRSGLLQKRAAGQLSR